MHPELYELFDSSISTFYQHGISRVGVKNNGATQGVKHSGDMRAMGWCPAAGVAADVGKDACQYSLNSATSQSEARIWSDVERNGLLLPRARDFWAEKFSNLSMTTFSANSKITTDSRVPSFESPAWESSANSQVWASSVTITRDNFHNKPHCDRDATPYAFGMFAQVNRLLESSLTTVTVLWRWSGKLRSSISHSSPPPNPPQARTSYHQEPHYPVWLLMPSLFKVRENGAGFGAEKGGHALCAMGGVLKRTHKGL
ncbi:uncharacterized protein MELLADRAFT_113183 [Melampsora larici-populina 98AG31]|uniref:Tet-like 2OG-Fe(II) oxygenase domain-containing protein n=1 Tax=Melampsora larici-populina (strain 98AG31 / pathotype 3-4-7) TaxID=747676 RepID=F4S915_MELLP|nr:uncharacterized protein MELLADRAFT_113183 [Melampsora larici-populina 98AG31]EGF98835.1 hypothetical protein MELLADRAFT_113183 [Melampsora larici-populina 98AG31]